MRLGAGLTATLSAGELGESNDFTLTELEARRIGRMLKSAGINWNLAPVVDVGTATDPQEALAIREAVQGDPL